MRKERIDMKLIPRCLVPVLVLVLLLSVIPSADAAVMVADPEETVSFILDYEAACAVEGEIRFSDDSIISNVQYNMSGSNMTGLVENGKIFLYTDNPEGVSGQVIITVTIHSAAPKGSSCIVTIDYALTEVGSDVPGHVQSIINTVTVRTDAPTETTPGTDDPPITYADTTKLREQIQIAESLTSYDYTKETWADVEKALTVARSLLGSTSQLKVDNATGSLKSALANLVSMDYSALQGAIESAGELGDMEELAEYWERFVAALSNARVQRTSGDQAAVDAATEELLISKEALIMALEELGEVVTIEKEVPVEVPPSYTFCNNIGHTIILIIMILSLVLNALLIGLIVYVVIRRRMMERDTTPLIDYSIDDDIPQTADDFE